MYQKSDPRFGGTRQVLNRTMGQQTNTDYIFNGAQNSMYTLCSENPVSKVSAAQPPLPFYFLSFYPFSIVPEMLYVGFWVFKAQEFFYLQPQDTTEADRAFCAVLLSSVSSGSVASLTALQKISQYFKYR